MSVEYYIIVAIAVAIFVFFIGIRIGIHAAARDILTNQCVGVINLCENKDGDYDVVVGFYAPSDLLDYDTKMVNMAVFIDEKNTSHSST